MCVKNAAISWGYLAKQRVRRVVASKADAIASLDAGLAAAVEKHIAVGA